jgi:hypothetical protein
MWQHDSILISPTLHGFSIKRTLLSTVGLPNELDPISVSYYCGWGKCNRDWCNCKAFEGNDDLCRNCGHPYSEHYGY